MIHTRIGHWNSIRTLVFIILSFFYLYACAPDNAESSVELRWEEGRATGISIPRKLLDGIQDDSISAVLTIHLIGSKEQPVILGDYTIEADEILFRPIFPFTRGVTYEIRIRNQTISNISIPEDVGNPPVLANIYPSQDTLPENLLKFYFQFTKPMREGQSLRHIVLLKNKQDTINDVFLDLQPELWNQESTLLTVWLDPGRIKRDLQPNKKLGNPLQKYVPYQLVVSDLWQDVNGSHLRDVYTKDFIVSSRDSISPSMDRWKITVPKSGTRQPLIVDFNESLDYVLGKETIRVRDGQGRPVEGQVSLSKEESVLEFVPHQSWERSAYVLESESRLEDLVGNNLNRLFDHDISHSKKPSDQHFYKRNFIIE